MFSDILLTVDFDRTLTGPDSKIPQRNLDAIAFFMENGGKFTVNTGRSVATFHKYLDKLGAEEQQVLFAELMGAAFQFANCSFVFTVE